MILPLAWWRRKPPQPWGNPAPEGELPRVIVEVYGKEGCHLCEEAEAIIAELAGALAERVEVELRHIDIMGDPELLRRYGERIPVVTVAGRPHAEWRVDRSRLERAILRAAR